MDEHPKRALWKRAVFFLLEAGLIVAGGAAVGLGFNAVYDKGIPLVAPYPYEIFSDCDEYTAEAEYIGLTNAFRKLGGEAIFVDARDPELFQAGHIPGAINITFDVLFPVEEELLNQVKGAPFVIVYDDVPLASDLKPAKELANEIKTRGVPKVLYLKEPIDAWKARTDFPWEGPR